MMTSFSPGDNRRRNLRLGIWDGLMATPWAFLSVPGNLIVAALLTQVFGIDKATYGIIVSLPAWSNALQIILIPALSRFLTPKELALGVSWFNVGLWTMLAAVLGFLPMDDSRGIAGLFLVFFALTSLSHSFIAIGWTSWLRGWVPRVIRGTYLGRRNWFVSMATVAYLLVAIGLFHAAPDALWPYQVLILSAVILRYGSIVTMYGIQAENENASLARRSWATDLREALQSREILVFIGFSAWTNFWLGFAGPFFPVFSFEELGLATGTFTTLVVLGSVSGMIGYAWWGRWIDRLGSVPILALGLFLWESSNYLWIALTPDNVWLLYPMWLWGGFFSVAYLLSAFNLLLKLVPERSQLAGISLYVGITAVAAALALVIGGALLNRLLPVAENSLLIYRIGFGLKSTCVLLGLLALRGFPEPTRAGHTSVPGAFRTLRNLLAVLGPGILSNFSPLSRRKK